LFDVLIKLPEAHDVKAPYGFPLAVIPEDFH
jgi:hypothetical protein